LDGTILIFVWMVVSCQFSGPREERERHRLLDFLDRIATENCSGVHFTPHDPHLNIIENIVVSFHLTKHTPSRPSKDSKVSL
jgi:hypothetical protein